MPCLSGAAGCLLLLAAASWVVLSGLQGKTVMIVMRMDGDCNCAGATGHNACGTYRPYYQSYSSDMGACSNDATYEKESKESKRDKETGERRETRACLISSDSFIHPIRFPICFDHIEMLSSVWRVSLCVILLSLCDGYGVQVAAGATPLLSLALAAPGRGCCLWVSGSQC